MKVEKWRKVMKKFLQVKYVVVFFTFIIVNTSFGQKVRNIDETYQMMMDSFRLEDFDQAKEYAQIIIDKDLIKSHIVKANWVIGEYNFHQYNFDTALIFFDTAKRLAKEDTLNINYLDIIISIGLTYEYKEDYEKSINLLFDAHSLAIKLKDKYKEAYTLLLLGSDFRKVDRFTESFQFLSRSMDIFTELDDCKNLFRIQSELGNLYILQSDPKSAGKYFRNALSYAYECGDKEDISVCLHNVATSQLDGDFEIDTVVSYLRRSLHSIPNGPYLDIDKYITYSMFASAFVEKNILDSADYYLQGMELLSKKNIDSTILFLLEGIRGRVYLKRKNYKRAIQYLRRSLFMQQVLDENYAVECKHIANAYAQIGQLDSAYYFLAKSEAISDSIKLVVSKAAILSKDISRRIEIENRELLTSQKEITLLQKQKSLSFLLMSVSIFFLIVLAYFIWVLSKKQKKITNSNLFLKKILDKSQDFIVIIDKNQVLKDYPKLKYKSPSAEMMLKSLGNPSSRTSLLEKVHKDDRARIEEISKQLLQLKEGESLTFELIFFDINKNCYNIESTATALWNDPVIEGMIFNSRDITKQKKREFQLKQSEKTFKDMFNNSTDQIYIINQKGELVNVNEEGIRISGYSREEVINKPLTILASKNENEKKKLSLIMEEVFLGNKKQSVFWGRSKTGENYPLLTSFSLGEYFGEKVIFVHAFDISDRMKAELLLKANEKKLSAYIEGTNVGIVTTNENGKIQFGNEAIIEMLACQSAGKLETLDWSEIIYEEDFGKFEELKKESVKNRKLFIDIRVKDRKGELLWVRVSYSKIEVSQYETQYIIVFINVDKEIKYRNELDKNLMVLKTLLNNIPSPVFLKEKNQNIVLWNNAFEKMIGKETKDIQGEKVFNFVPFKPIHQEMDLKAIEDGYVAYDFIADDYKGGMSYFKIHKAAIYDENNEVSGIIVTTIDFTEIQSKTKSLELLNSTQSTILSLISHDFRSIIATQKSLTDFILSSDVTYDEIIELQQSMKPSIDSTFNMIDNILIWARSQKEEISFEPKNILIYPIIEENIKTVLMYAHIKEILLEKDIPKDLMAHLDVHQFNAIIQNLLSNAIKFTGHKGKVSISATESNSAVLIIVEDNGIGMDSDTIQLILGGEEVKSARGTENEKGSGLGLKIIRDFVHLHGGKIEIESIPKQGSKITLIFPKVKSNQFNS